MKSVFVYMRERQGHLSKIWCLRCSGSGGSGRLYSVSVKVYTSMSETVLPDACRMLLEFRTILLTFKKYKTFSVLIYSYINTSGNWKNEKLCGNTTPAGRSVFTQF